MNWEQFKAIVWLRWRLTRNRFSRGGPLNAVFSILILVFLCAAAVGAGAGGFLLGMFATSKVPPLALLFIWDGVVFFFLLFWFVGLMVEIQRSESIDIEKLLHLPVTLQQVFVFNYAASHLTPIIAILVPGMLGLCAGMTLRSPAMALMVPLVLGFIFAVTAWTYCLRGWLAALMANKRRRRAIIVWITLALVLFGQLPNLIFNTPLFGLNNRSRHGQHRRTNGPNLPDWFVGAHAAVPPGWIGFGAMRLKEGDAVPALGLAATGFLLGILGLTKAYRMTMRFYQGADAKKSPRVAPMAPAVSRANGILFVERRVPWLADDTAALALATFRSLTRAPELKMALIMPVFMCIIMSSAFFKHARAGNGNVWAAFAASAAVIGAAFSLAPTMSNSFGLDRNGFRALVLLPLRRDRVLFAKNLAFFPFVALVTLLLLAAVTYLLRLPATSVAVALVQIPTAFLLCAAVANFISILAPYRMAAGTLKAAKPKAIVFVAAFAALLVTPIMLTPLLIPPALQLLAAQLNWPRWLPFHLIAALAILAGVVCLYALLLPAQGRLLQSREQTILREVTEDAE